MTGMDVEMVSFRSAGMKYEDNRRRNSAQQMNVSHIGLNLIQYAQELKISNRQMTIKTEMLW